VTGETAAMQTDSATRVHGYSQNQVADLPVAGRNIILMADLLQVQLTTLCLLHW